MDDYILNGDGVVNFNLKGFMVGNGVTNWDYDGTPAYVEMAYWHGMYDNALYRKIHENNCLEELRRFDAEQFSTPCIEAFVRFEHMVAGTNTYDVYGKCWPAPNNGEAKYLTAQ